MIFIHIPASDIRARLADAFKTIGGVCISSAPCNNDVEHVVNGRYVSCGVEVTLSENHDDEYQIETSGGDYLTMIPASTDPLTAATYIRVFGTAPDLFMPEDD